MIDEKVTTPREMIEHIPVWCRFDAIVRVDELKKHPKNNNTHPKKQIELLAKIITSVGWRAPITVSSLSGYITKGHGRLLAATLIGSVAVPVEYQAYKTEAEELADLSADNKIAELSILDEGLTRTLLLDLKSSGYDLELAGFLIGEADKLIELGSDGEKDPDDVPDIGGLVPVCQRGQLWELGDHLLLCGSAAMREDAARLMENGDAHMVFTDPPYNVNYQGGTKQKLKIKSDNMTHDAFSKLITSAMENMYRHTVAGGGIYVCYSDSEAITFRTALSSVGWELQQCLIWEKNQFVLGRRDYHHRHEPILYAYKPGSKRYWYGGRKQDTVVNLPDGVLIERIEENATYITVDVGLQRVVIKVPDHEIVFAGDDALQTIWKVKKPLRNEEHPTIKPVELIERALRNSSQPGDIVADFFGGSGSTMIACERLNRRARMLELDPVYCDVIVGRWEKFSGKKAVLVGSK